MFSMHNTCDRNPHPPCEPAGLGWHVIERTE